VNPIASTAAFAHFQQDTQIAVRRRRPADGDLGRCLCHHDRLAQPVLIYDGDCSFCSSQRPLDHCPLETVRSRRSPGKHLSAEMSKRLGLTLDECGTPRGGSTPRAAAHAATWPSLARYKPHMVGPRSSAKSCSSLRFGGLQPASTRSSPAWRHAYPRHTGLPNGMIERALGTCGLRKLLCVSQIWPSGSVKLAVRIPTPG